MGYGGIVAGYCNDYVPQSGEPGAEYGGCKSCPSPRRVVEPNHRRPSNRPSTSHWANSDCESVTIYSEEHDRGSYFSIAGLLRIHLDKIMCSCLELRHVYIERLVELCILFAFE